MGVVEFKVRKGKTGNEFFGDSHDSEIKIYNLTSKNYFEASAYVR